MENDINQHVRDYLDRYLGREAKYAVLITGAWGSGKTHLVRDHVKDRQSTIFVSANGVATTRDLTERLYLAAYPILADKTMRALGSITKTIAGAFRIKSDLKMEDLIGLDQIRTIVVDDVERSKIPIDELFGFLNEFIEHDDKHVILIGNELEIPNDARYKIIKEKVVGFTASVEPDYEAVIDKFTSQDDTYTDFIRNKRLMLIGFLREGNLGNLRILENSLEDAEDVFAQISNAGLSADQIDSIFFPFLLLAYYYRKGEIDRRSLESRQVDSLTRIFAQQRDGHVPEGIEKIASAHSQVDLFTTDIDNDFLVAKICDGRSAKDLLDRTLGDIKGRSNPDANPEWRNLWYFLQQEDDVLESSFSRMMSKFNDRKYLEAGEILHVFGLLYNMKNVGLLHWNKKEIEEQCKTYIDDLCQKEVIPKVDQDFIGGFRHGAAHGLGFTSSEEPGFRRLFAYLTQRSSEGQDRRIESELVDIIEHEPFDLAGFRGIILQGDRQDNVYNRPFLTKIDPSKFAAAIFREKANSQFEVLYALRSRYYQSPYPDVRANEASWLRRLIHALRKIPKSNLTRERLNQVVDITILEHSKVS